MATGKPSVSLSLPSATQLDEMVVHIGYEVAALETSIERFAREKDRFIEEAALLHVRLLREFLWGQRTKKSHYNESSVYAEDYFPDRTYWASKKGKVTTTLADTKEAIDKQLAHVCRERTDPSFTKNLETHLPSLRDELLDQWGKFTKALNEPASKGTHGVRLVDARTRELKRLHP